MSLEQTIAEFKSKELSPFCLDKCTLPCCCFDNKKLSLPVTDSQLSVLYEKTIKDSLLYLASAYLGFENTALKVLSKLKFLSLKGKGILAKTKTNNNKLVNTVCPRYDQKTRKCQIHENPDRPQACSSFPIYLSQKDGLILDTRCPYIKENWKSLLSVYSPLLKERNNQMSIIFPSKNRIIKQRLDLEKYQE